MAYTFDLIKCFIFSYVQYPIGLNAYCSLTGLHVAVVMFTGYLVGYAAFKALFGHSPAMVTSRTIA